MLECFNVYLEWLRASQPYALFPENYKTTQLDNKLCQSLEAVPECPFQSAVLRALQWTFIDKVMSLLFKYAV